MQLLPHWTVDVTNSLLLTGRVTCDHWDDIDPLLMQIEHLVGNVMISHDQPEWRMRQYEANAHPYLMVRLNVHIRTESSKLTVDKTHVTRVLDDYQWRDTKEMG